MNKKYVQGNSMSALSNQPQDFIRTTRDAFRLFAASFLKAWPLSLFGNVFIVISIFLIRAFSDQRTSENSWWFLLALYAFLVLYPVVMASVLVQVQAVADERPIRLTEAFGRGFRCVVPSTIGAAIFVMSVSIGSVLLFVPGIILFVSLSFW